MQGKRYREFHARLVDDTSWKGIAYRIVGYEVDAHLLVQRVCLDYALRFVLLFSTGFALAVYLTFVRFGYNHHFYAIGECCNCPVHMPLHVHRQVAVNIPTR
jgi:hypothetical protein